MIALLFILPILLGYGVLEATGVFDSSSSEDIPADEIDFIKGTKEDDLLNGTGGEDIIIGNDGNDTMDGQGGADVIYGRWGADEISGGTGGDYIHAGYGSDLANGNDGADLMTGGGGADTLYGGHVGDIVLGSTGNDEVYGNRGDDIVTGGAGSDIVSGGMGDDLVSGSTHDYTNTTADYTPEYIAAMALARELYPDATLEELHASPELEGIDLTFLESDGVADGADSLWAGPGNDTLLIGDGDEAVGGIGSDTFIMYGTGADGTSLIKDFDPEEEDVLQIYVAGATAETAPEVSIAADNGNAIISVGDTQVAVVEGGEGKITAEAIQLLFS